MTILVTGPTGFVGRRVVEALTSTGTPVRALVRSMTRASVLSEYDVEIALGDVLDPESLRRACEGVDGIIHLAAIIREGPGSTFQRINIQGTKNVLEAAVSAKVGRIVHASTLGAGSDPALPYLYSRWVAEQEVVQSPLSHTIVRYSAGFGDGDEFLNMMAAQVRLSPLVPVAGDGNARFQPIAVEDIARSLVSAYERQDTAGKTFEVGGPEYFTYDEMLDLIADTLGARIVKVHVPLPIMSPLAAIMETLMPRPPVTGEQLKMLRLDNTTDLDSMEKTFGFAPRSLRDNIGYISRISLRDALRMNLGFMPAHIRDH
jgi:NADH dehydrogenase